MLDLLKNIDHDLTVVTEEKIALVEKEMLKHDQVDCPVIHRFGPGVYIREVSIPAGSTAIGHTQNFEHLNIFLKGRVSILEDNGEVKELTAPMIFVGQPGRKIGFIHEDVTWLNVYSTDITDIEKLESIYLTKSDGFTESVENIKAKIDNEDFKKAIAEYGFTEELVESQSLNELDMTPLPYGNYKFKRGNSSIHGKGLFATANIEVGEILAPARIAGKRTIAGRFTNHSINPNAVMKKGIVGEIDLVALKTIKGCHGGFDGEEITVDYRDSVKITLEMGEKCRV